ncbi:MAG: hypothetical protein ACTSU4_08005 [Promethearchaeota archaeon]
MESFSIPPHETPIKGLWFIDDQSETFGGLNSRHNESKKRCK